MYYRIIVLIVLIPMQLSAQKDLDSLYSLWEDVSRPDSVRAKAYLDYIWDGFVYSMPDSAIVLAEDLIRFSEKTSSLEVARSAYNVQGVAYYVKGDNTNALERWMRSLKIAEETGHLSGISSSLSNIGNIYADQGDYTQALDFYFRSLKIAERQGDVVATAARLDNIGTVYFNEEDYPKALEHYLRVLKLEEQENLPSTVSSLSNIGASYSVQGEFDKALEYYSRGLKTAKKTGDKQGEAMILLNTGIMKFRQQEYQQSIEWCKKAYNLAVETNALRDQKSACDHLYRCHKALGNDNRALEYLERIQSIDNDLNSEETAKQLQRMEFAKQVRQDSISKVNSDRIVQNSHDKVVRNKNRTRNWLIGAGLLVLIIAGGLLARVRYIRKSKAALQIEKDQSENLLLNILPADIAAELKEKGRADARDFENVSILFTDFKGFTAASEKLSAQELVAEINICFEAFDGIMEKYEIEKIKTIGDAYMAAGGLPVPSEQSTKNIVLAAIEMQAFITTRKAKNDALNKPAFQMRVGIHTGPIVAGIVGVKKFAYDIWGDTVNTASRMESSGEVGKVNISQATYKLLKEESDFIFVGRGEIEAKGKGKMEMYFVEAASTKRT
jgi:adenylate cyclase